MRSEAEREVYGRNYIFCRQDTFSASKTLASRGYLKTLFSILRLREAATRVERRRGPGRLLKAVILRALSRTSISPVYKMNTWKLEPRFYTRTRVFGHECTRARGRNRKPRSSRITTGAICSLSLSLPPWPTLDTPPIPEWTHVWPTQAEYTQAILYLLNDARYLEEAMRVYPGVSARPIVASLNVQREALVVDR